MMSAYDVVVRRTLMLGRYTVERRNGPTHLRHLADLEQVPVSGSVYAWRANLAAGVPGDLAEDLYRTRAAAVDAVLDAVNAPLVERMHPCLDDVACTLADGHTGGCVR